MARTIAVSDEVYELLKRTKIPGESFSTVMKPSLKRSSNRAADKALNICEYSIQPSWLTW